MKICFVGVCFFLVWSSKGFNLAWKHIISFWCLKWRISGRCAVWHFGRVSCASCTLGGVALPQNKYSFAPSRDEGLGILSPLLLPLLSYYNMFQSASNKPGFEKFRLIFIFSLYVRYLASEPAFQIHAPAFLGYTSGSLSHSGWKIKDFVCSDFIWFF